MNNHSTQIDFLPKLINNQQKLLDPIYIKNTQQRHSQYINIYNNSWNESKILPHLEKKSMMQGNSKQMVVQRFMHSFEYNTRNFGTTCDKGFQVLSSYHLSQKFGHFGTKLQPVEKNITADLTDGEDVEEIKKDEGLFYKKIYKYNQIPVQHQQNLLKQIGSNRRMIKLIENYQRVQYKIQFNSINTKYSLRFH